MTLKSSVSPPWPKFAKSHSGLTIGEIRAKTLRFVQLVKQEEQATGDAGR
jgi:hypothetical protein